MEESNLALIESNKGYKLKTKQRTNYNVVENTTDEYLIYSCGIDIYDAINQEKKYLMLNNYFHALK